MTPAEKRKKKLESRMLSQARRSVLAEIDRLDAERCDACRLPNSIKPNCECYAATRVRELGNALCSVGVIPKVESVKIKKVVKPVETKESLLKAITPETFTVEVYETLKRLKVSDTEIQKRLAWHGSKFYAWKGENGLIKRQIPGRSKVERAGMILNGLSVEKYIDLKSEGVTDLHIKAAYKIAETTFDRWKAANKPAWESAESRKPAPPVLTPVAKVDDVINGPAHYLKNGIDVIGFAEMQLPTEQLIGFCRINVLKYATRYDRKNGIEDLKKCRFYIEKLMELEAAKL